MDRNYIINQLGKYRSAIDNFGVESIALFGSYSINTARYDSDIDIYVKFKSGMENYDNFIGLCFYLDTLFPGKKVEVVTFDGMSPYIEPEVKRNAIYV